MSGLLSGLPFRFFSRMVRIRQYRERAKFWKYVLEQLNSLSCQLERQEGAAREITARLAQASDNAQRDWVAAEGKQHGNVGYLRHRAGCWTARHGKIDVAPFHFGYHLSQRTGI